MIFIKELYKDVIFEDEDYEFNERLNKKDTINWVKSFSAFANTNGGIIFIGVDDHGMVKGLTYNELDETKRIIYSEVDLHLFPKPDFKFLIHNEDASFTRFVLAVIIQPSNQIVKYKGGKYFEQVYIRKNGESDPASIETLGLLLRRKEALAFDTKILKDKYKEEDFKELIRVFKENITNKDFSSNLLININALTEQKELTYGLSLFKDNCKDINTRIDCRLYNGFDKTAEVLDNKQYIGNLLLGYRQMKNFITLNTKHGYKKLDNGGQNQLYSYPPKSIDEILINSLAHRDYSITGSQINLDVFLDHIDIYSPGNWLLTNKPEQINWKNMISIRRNQIICNIFSLIGLMEQAGSGFKQVYEDYRTEDKKPEFIDYSDYFVVTIPDLLFKEKIKEKVETINNKALIYERLPGYRPYDDIVLNACYDKPLSRAEIQKFTTYKSPNSVIKAIINPLVEKGYLIKKGPDRIPNQEYFTNKKLVKK